MFYYLHWSLCISCSKVESTQSLLSEPHMFITDLYPIVASCFCYCRRTKYVHKNNKQAVIRLSKQKVIEVWNVSGKRMGGFPSKPPAKRSPTSILRDKNDYHILKSDRKTLFMSSLLLCYVLYYVLRLCPSILMNIYVHSQWDIQDRSEPSNFSNVQFNKLAQHILECNYFLNVAVKHRNYNIIFCLL